MFRIIDDLFTLFLEVANGIFDHIKIFFGSCPEHIRNMEEPGFPKNGNHRSGRVEEEFNLCILFNGSICPTSGTEGCNAGMGKLEFFRFLEKRHVPRITARPSAFNVIDPKLIKFFSNAHLGGYGKGNPFRLGAVAQSSVVNKNFRG